MRLLVFFSFLGLTLVCGCVFSSKRARFPEVAEVPFEPVRRIPSHFDFIEDQAFPIAEVLDSWNVSNDEWELLSLAQLIVEKSEEIGVTPALALALIETESTFDPCARSSVGAMGLMQVMPKRILGHHHVQEAYAFNYHLFYDPQWNINFGMDYLGSLIERFGRLDHAIAAYNLGPTRLSYRLRTDRYSETLYLRRIMKREERYAQRLNPVEPVCVMQVATVSGV